MSGFSRKFGIALALAALCLGGRAAHAQAAPVSYWLPNWPLGFGSSLSAASSANSYGNFPSFDGTDASGNASSRFNFSNGWFVGSERANLGLTGFSQDPAFGNFHTEGMQFGYNFKNSGGLPVTVFAGFDTLKYNTGIGNPFAPFDSQSGTAPGYSAHAGVEIKPTSNLSLSLGVGYSQQSGDINSLVLPGASPFANRH